MLKNVIVFGGSSGSSVLTGFLARAGYWVGEETKKVAFETFENSELVELDSRILRETGSERRQLGAPILERTRKVAESLDPTDFQAFVRKCDDHRPWIWKDPRLSFTIFYWVRLLNLDECRFIVITRDVKQSWTGRILRGGRKGSLAQFRAHQQRSLDSADLFLRENGLPSHRLTFEDLILNPAETILSLNEFLGTKLTLEDLQSVYRGQLYRNRWTRFDYAKAQMIFWSSDAARRLGLRRSAPP